MLTDTFRFVVPFTRAYWRRYAFGLALTPLSAWATLQIATTTGECVRALESGNAASALFHAATTRSAVPWYLSWAAWIPSWGLLPDLTALAVTAGLTLFGIRWFIISASRRVEFDIRNRLFEHLQRLDQAYYSSAKTGDLMSRMTADVERTRLLVGPIILYASRTLLLLAIGIPLMIQVSWLLTVMVMVPLSLMTVAVRVIGPRVHRETFRSSEMLSEISSLAQENFSGIRVVQSFAQEPAETARFGALSKDYLEQNLRVVRVQAWMHPIIGAVGDLALISLLVIGGGLMLDGSIDTGSFFAFCGYQGALIWPMLSIGWVVNQYHRARASVDRLRELLETKPSVLAAAAPHRFGTGRGDGTDASRGPESIRGAVSIRNLHFSYGEREALRDIDLEAPAGSTIAILGRTGAGKSTLLQLVPRLWNPPPGSIFVDGVDVNTLDLGELRRAIGYVPQESFHFSRTVRENIAFGAGELSDQELAHVARVARFDKDLDQFPDGYEAMVGERGVTLSGGQKQRASLARALAIRPRILLLDDAFSAIDAETEEEILRGLPEATGGITTIVVSHRVSSIAHADRIYVLDEGAVAESGTHRELLALGGLYAETHRLQQLSDELDHM